MLSFSVSVKFLAKLVFYMTWTESLWTPTLSPVVLESDSDPKGSESEHEDSDLDSELVDTMV